MLPITQLYPNLDFANKQLTEVPDTKDFVDFQENAIPTMIHLVGRNFQDADRASSIGRPFGAWISGDLDLTQGRCKSVSASIEILLPMAAAVIGITAIGAVFRLTEVGSSWT